MATLFIFGQIQEYVRTHGCDAAKRHYNRYSWKVQADVNQLTSLFPSD